MVSHFHSGTLSHNAGALIPRLYIRLKKVKLKIPLGDTRVREPWVTTMFRSPGLYAHISDLYLPQTQLDSGPRPWAPDPSQ